MALAKESETDEATLLAMADKKRSNQGFLEMEIWAEGHEGTFQWEKCTKNPGHHEFIPRPEFSMNHLPENYRDEGIMKMINSSADMTVRLRVKYTCTKRPDGYTFSECRGLRITHTGTGALEYEPALCNDGTPCKCHQCIDSPQPALRWWKITIQTARHVVYDIEEAQNTFVDCFFDDASQPKKFKTMQGTDEPGYPLTGDYYSLICATHEDEIGQAMLDAWNKYREFLYSSLLDYRTADEKVPLLAVIASHPHGCAKHISVGNVRVRKQEGNAPKPTCQEWIVYTYTTATCRGSSGAAVHFVEYVKDKGFKLHGNMHYHSEGFPDGVNKSGIMFETIH